MNHERSAMAVRGLLSDADELIAIAGSDPEAVIPDRVDIVRARDRLNLLLSFLQTKVAA